MAKLKYLITAISFLTVFFDCNAQSYAVHYVSADTDTTQLQKMQWQSGFASKAEAILYISRLPSVLQTKGYLTASIDSVHYDSSFAVASVFLGLQYKWA